MSRILFLAHRLPYPPNKGDKIHTFHLLEHISRRHDVLLGTFVDDPADEVHVPFVRSLCAELHVSRLNPSWARARALSGLLRGEPLSVAFYRDRAFARWIDGVRRERRADALLVYSSSMVQYAAGFDVPMVIDFADVDSAKWSQYAERHKPPMSWVYRREARRLLQVEREGTARSQRAFFATRAEAQLFAELAPEVADRADVLGNGVDADYFSPDPARASPYAPGEQALVFTGAMDYWPNVDAVCWFASEVLPGLRERHPGVRLTIVGRSPAAAVRALQCADITVTGSVDDVRPYLQHAAVAVAPLRLARGIQNKVLEAMAMQRPVVTAVGCAEAIAAEIGRELLSASEPSEYADIISALLREPERAAAIGAAGRRRVVSDYTWLAHLSALDRHLEGASRPVPGASPISPSIAGAFRAESA